MYTYRETMTIDDPQCLTLRQPLPFRKGQPVEILVLALTTPQVVVETSHLSLTDFQQFLLDSPEMSEEEHLFIQEKRRQLNQWK